MDELLKMTAHDVSDFFVSTLQYWKEELSNLDIESSVFDMCPEGIFDYSKYENLFKNKPNSIPLSREQFDIVKNKYLNKIEKEFAY